ncbi:hypothetical protein KKG61_08840 [bacterium]|nr:hypothetical protein [bacterium]MBU1600188.1 hypothetical protein [bacterium]MBU2461427.1 hypothetical protein [bacterium]
MKKSAIFLFLILAFPNLCKAQEGDISIVIQKGLLNKVLSAIGSITGTGTANLPFHKGEYSWVAKEPRIIISPEKVEFFADVQVKVGFFKYSPKVEGVVSIEYATATNRIIVEVKSAEFEIYLGLFGKRLHITDINLAKFYKQKIEFPGPEPIDKGIEIEMQDGRKKSLLAQVESCSLNLEKGAIRVTSILSFKEKFQIGTNSATIHRE